MDTKQGFFSSLKHEVVRGLSPGKSRPKSPLRSTSPAPSLRRRRKAAHRLSRHELFFGRSGSLRPAEALSPLKEGPDDTDGEDPKMEGRWAQWMKGQLCRAPSVSCSAYKRSDLRLLLGVLGAPLAPVHVASSEPLPHLCIKDTPIVSPSPLSSVSFVLNLRNFSTPISLFHQTLGGFCY